MLALQKLVQNARARGWACADGQIESSVYQASLLDWEIVPTRNGEPGVETLKPIEAEKAPAKSLSALTGLGAQPLHTDGAHHPIPPDIILLAVDEPSAIDTLLLRMSDVRFDPGDRDAIEHGVFTVRNGPAAFLATAYAKRQVRFDPGCMTPGDSRARRTIEFFAALASTAESHSWARGGQVLAIDNRRVLHARCDAHEEPARIMKRIAFRTMEAQQ